MLLLFTYAKIEYVKNVRIFQKIEYVGCKSSNLATHDSQITSPERMYATYRATSAGATVLIARGSIATAALRIRLKISTAACLACAPSRGGILGPASKTDTQHAV